MLYQLEDGSIHNDAGRLVYMSTDRFIETIVDGDCCLICGRDPTKTKFNKEHILSNWILDRYELHDRHIDLPNATGHTYGSYTIPCCVDCNGLMNKIFEIPIRQQVLQGHSQFKAALFQEGPLRLFTWLALIFLKTHLKDTLLPLERDTRKGVKGSISDLYTWKEIHHLHCVARTFWTMCHLDRTAIGTLFLMPALPLPGNEQFDYVDNNVAQTVMIRLDDVALVAVLNDGGAVGSIFKEDLLRLPGPMDPIELRELFVHFTNINLGLENRPTFRTNTYDGQTKLIIHADDVPSEWRTRSFDPEIFAKLMKRYCYDTKTIVNEKHDPDLLNQGKLTFLKEPEGGYMYKTMQTWPNHRQ